VLVHGHGQSAHAQAGAPIPARLPPDTPLFDVPDKLCKILNRDLRLAGIPKRDDRGRVLDVHALRHTFGTLLSKGGVSPRTAQAAMRHSKLDLTMSVYTDPRLLDVRGALDALPALPLQSEAEAARATGTGNETARTLAPTAYNGGQILSIAGNLGKGREEQAEKGLIAVTSSPDNRKGPLSSADNGPLRVGATGLEPVTPSVSRWVSLKFPLVFRMFWGKISRLTPQFTPRITPRGTTSYAPQV